MARTKNNFLNAKPVSKMGGGSGGVRKPGKPYQKPPASTKGKPKVKPKPGKPVAKAGDPWKAPSTQNSRTSAPKENTTFRTQDTRRLTLPNSQRAGTNLPKDGAAYLRGQTQGPKAPTNKPAVKPTAKPSASKPASTAPKPKPTSSKPNPYTSGKPNPTAAVRGVKGGGPNALARNLKFGRGNAAAIALGALNMLDDARLTAAQRAKKYEVVNPDRGQNLLTKLQSGTLGKLNNSVKRDPNGRSSQGVNTPQGRTVATGSQQYNDYRNRQIADNRARLQGVGNPPKPTPPAPRQQPPVASAPAVRPSANRPSQTSPSRTTATASGSQQTRPAEKKPSMGREAFDRSGKGSLGPNYGIDQFGDKNGIDMERRRAFLDAKDSQEGRKAISKLMEERRKKQRENDSTSK